MISKAELLLEKIKKLNEELFFPTSMNLRNMNPSEVTIYKAVTFPNSTPPLIGSFLNVSWVAMLDYSGITIRSIDNSSKSYFLPYRARSSEELVSVFRNTLDCLVRLTSEDQLYDNDFLAKHKFLANTNRFG